MIPGTDLVRKDSIEEMCGHRARALQLYKQAMDTLNAAEDAHQRACGGGRVSTQHLRDVQYSGERDRVAAAARLEVDRGMWRHFIDATPLGSLMDAEERRRFEDSLKSEDVPEVTPDNVFATLSRLAGDADMIFRRGLVNAFRHFCGDYRSHDGFKIGPRFLIPRVVGGSGTFRYLNHYHTPEVQDIDRCMHVLDGKPAPEYQQGVRSAIEEGARRGHSEVTSDYFRVRLYYGNGNAHFYPLRQDLVTQANKLIAAHYGEALGAGHAARHAA
jgi:hypothetical protein